MRQFTPGTYPAFIDNYVCLVDADTVAEAVEKYSDRISNFFINIPESRVNYSYAAGKWTIKEMLQHIIDTERIFAYRALRIARQDKTPLPGFDEKTYAATSKANERAWKSLLEEFEAVRKSTDLMLLSFTPEQLQQTGITNNEPNTVDVISFAIYGHILHHINILQERYL